MSKEAEGTLKKCSKCGSMLPRESFGKSHDTYDKLQAYCLECMKADGAERRRKSYVINPDAGKPRGGRCRRSANIHGCYVARDRDGSLWLFGKRPMRVNGEHQPVNGDRVQAELGRAQFPELKWEDGPMAVVVRITEHRELKHE